jgi:glutamate-1-semialdehyde 2,1-aminomutase
MNIEESRRLFAEAQTLFPGGVSSPVRAFKAVGGQPLFIERAEKAWLYDVDGNRFIDYVLSWGPLILGHAHEGVAKAIAAAALRGTSYGAPCALELELARAVRELMPNIEMLRFVNSGTEATMSALRLARAFTKRDKIVKFEGCYHGHADLLLVHAGSGVATFGLPDSPGVTKATAEDTLTAPYNDLGTLKALLERHWGEVAAIIVEPVAGNMGVVPPKPGFLEGLRALCDSAGALLIFDEVMTGFRVHLGGAQTLYGVKPDLSTLGKIIGGGLPVGAYGGRADIMSMVAPSGPVYQAGTLSGNPLAMTAGIVTLGELRRPGAWSRLEDSCVRLEKGLARAASMAGLRTTWNRVGAMFTTFFAEGPVTDWPSAKASDTRKFAAFFTAMLENGVYLAPSQFEAGFMSLAHGEAEIDATIAAAEKAFASIPE